MEVTKRIMEMRGKGLLKENFMEKNEDNISGLGKWVGKIRMRK